MPTPTNTTPLSDVITDEKSDHHFTGTYKGARIEISRDKENDDDYYILVWGTDGSLAYDGWWDDSKDATVDQAILEAIDGAML